MKQILLALALIAAPVSLFSAYEVMAHVSGTTPAGLGDMSQFETIVSNVQTLVGAGDIAGAKARITDYETAWDSAETALRPLDQELWSTIDEASDAALRALRAGKPEVDTITSKLGSLMKTLQDASSPAA